ncbi:hypothetical protein KSF73_02310 [Burkholderiaceae bacterium DAT-1]|nr:hypothetical protein [Burkholderiaceae bacterium DAT-1]
MKKAVLGGCLVLASLAAYADEQTPMMTEQANYKPFRFIVQAGLTGGGDKLATVETSKGTDKLYAGNLVQLGAGVVFQSQDYPIALQATLNYHVDNRHYKNGDATFSRFPFEVLGFYQFSPQWRIGAGIRHIGTAKLKLDADGASESAEYAGENSSVIELGYAMNDRVWLSGRYVHETLKLQKYNGIDVSRHQLTTDGSHVGIFMSAQF